MLVCWLSRESLQRECSQLVCDLWGQGITAELLHEGLELDSVEDIQEFCKKEFITHIVLLTDRTLYFEKKQVCMNIKLFLIADFPNAHTSACTLCVFCSLECVDLQQDN